MADPTVWPWVALLACAVALLGLVGAVVGMRRWGGPSQRYEVPDGTTPEAAGPRGERVASDWDELSAGRDPTDVGPDARDLTESWPNHRVIDPCTKVDAMSEHDDDHGHSVAAWSAVIILIVAAAIMSLAVLFPNGWLFVGGAVAGRRRRRRRQGAVHGGLRRRPSATATRQPSIH